MYTAEIIDSAVQCMFSISVFCIPFDPFPDFPTGKFRLLSSGKTSSPRAAIPDTLQSNHSSLFVTLTDSHQA